MRLIDADALHSNFFDYSPREMVWDRGDVEHKINEMPTIPAIPVAWLRERMQYPCMTCANPFDYVFCEWMNEPEAQDGKA